MDPNACTLCLFLALLEKPCVGVGSAAGYTLGLDGARDEDGPDWFESEDPVPSDPSSW